MINIKSVDLIDTIIIVMLENRSFDHVLGHLSLPPFNRADVDGLKGDSDWFAQFANPAPTGGNSYGPAVLTKVGEKLATDPLHERQNIAIQIGNSTPSYPVGGYPMNGFVKSCPTLHPDTDSPIVMGYYEAEDVFAAHFFAQNFGICDRWFAPLPAGTQPNRLMAVSGYSSIDVNRSLDLPNQDLVFDWLSRNQIRWRVYHDGLPFLAMMPKCLEKIVLSTDFRSYDDFRRDNLTESKDEFPQVIFIEPRYTNAPHVQPANDDHAPSPITNGQNFLMQIYGDLVANPERWARMVMIVTYDEHGGFFDHVSPLPTNPTGAQYFKNPFISTGVRVPAFVISPLVPPQSTSHSNMDHTAILKFIAKKFGRGSGYSPDVDNRLIDDKPVGDIAEILSLASPRSAIPFPEQMTTGFTPDQGPMDLTSQALKRALDTMRKTHPQETETKFKELTTAFDIDLASG